MVAISFSRESSRPRNRTRVSCIAGRRFTLWATREAFEYKVHPNHPTILIKIQILPGKPDDMNPSIYTLWEAGSERALVYTHIYMFCSSIIRKRIFMEEEVVMTYISCSWTLLHIRINCGALKTPRNQLALRPLHKVHGSAGNSEMKGINRDIDLDRPGNCWWLSSCWLQLITSKTPAWILTGLFWSEMPGSLL